MMRWLFLFILFIAACGANNMPLEQDGSKWQIWRQRDLTGGENISVSAQDVAVNQFVKLENIKLDARGRLTNNGGISALTSDSFAIYGAWDFQKTDGSRFLIIADSDNKIKAVAWNGTTIKPNYSFTLQSGAFNTAVVWAVQWKDTMIFCNGVSSPIAFNGSTFSTLASAPKLYCPKIYKEKLWGIDGDNPTHVCFSAAGDHTSWNALDFVTVDMGDGDIITQITPQVAGMVVFTETDNAVIYGSSKTDISVELHHFQNRVGCPSAKPGAVLDQGYVFSVSGIYRFDFNQMQKIEGQNQFFYPATMLAQWPGRTFEQITKSMVGVYDYVNRRAVFASTTFYYDVRTKALTGVAINNDCYGVVVEGNGGTEKIKILNSNAGNSKVYSLCEFRNTDLQQYNFLVLGAEVYSVNPALSTSILPVVIQTGALDFGTERDKHFRTFAITTENPVNAVTIKYSLNGGAWVTLGTYDFIAGENGFWLDNVRGETISFEISTSNAITISEMIWKYRPIGKVLR